MSVKIDKLLGGCDIDTSQKINSTVKALSSMDSVDTKELQNTIKNAANAQIDQAAKAQTGFFATAPSDSKTVSNYKNSVSNIVETNITDKQKVEAFASVYNKNENKLDIGECGDGPGATNSSKINASQNIVSDLVAQALLKSVSSALQKLDASNTSDTSVKQDSSAKSSGLDDVIKAIGDLLTGLFGAYAMYVLGCCIVCSCLLCFLLVGAAAMSAGGGGAPPQNPANIAAGVAALGKMPVAPAA
jgi:hypothetical protein